MDWSAVMWLVLMVFFLLMESSTVTLVSIWFAVGSLSAMIVSLFGGEFWLEGVVCVAVSAVLLAALRPVVRKYLNPKIEKTNVDALLGKQGMVIASVDNIRSTGTVKLGGVEWSARSTDGNPIEEGKIVRVDKVEGVKAFVSVVE